MHRAEKVVAGMVLISKNHSGFSCGVPQQLPGSPPQLHSPLSISLPRSAALIIAHAHPTPLCTMIA
jgi:hypothetical protein